MLFLCSDTGSLVKVVRILDHYIDARQIEFADDEEDGSTGRQKRSDLEAEP
jgi:hypothetical protein